MDKLVVPSPSNGFPLNNDDIRYFLGLSPYSKGIYQALEGILSAYGDNLIVSGCEVSGSDIAEGWVMLDGELIKVDAHTATDDYFEKVTTYNSAGNKQTQTGGLEDSYEQNRAIASASSGTLESPTTGNPAKLGKEFSLNLIRNDDDFESDETNKGVVKKGTSAELIAETVDANITADNIDVLTDKTKQKVFEIGVWNMDTSPSAQVSFLNILDFTSFRSISVFIRNDINTQLYPLDFSNTGVNVAGNHFVHEISQSVQVIILTRIAGGFFDSTDFNDAVINRGYVIVDYV